MTFALASCTAAAVAAAAEFATAAGHLHCCETVGFAAGDDIPAAGFVGNRAFPNMVYYNSGNTIDCSD